MAKSGERTNTVGVLILQLENKVSLLQEILSVGEKIINCESLVEKSDQVLTLIEKRSDSFRLQVEILSEVNLHQIASATQNPHIRRLIQIVFDLSNEIVEQNMRINELLQGFQQSIRNRIDELDTTLQVTHRYVSNESSMLRNRIPGRNFDEQK